MRHGIWPGVDEEQGRPGVLADLSLVPVHHLRTARVEAMMGHLIKEQGGRECGRNT